MTENSALKSSGAEALLAAQWRQRYEMLLKEKEEVAGRLQMQIDKADVLAEQRRKVDSGKYEMKYRDLKESFRLYRKKAKEIFEAQQRGDVGVSCQSIFAVAASSDYPTFNISRAFHQRYLFSSFLSPIVDLEMQNYRM